MDIYTVRSGDTVFSISRKYNVPEQIIIADNRITNPNNLVPGQDLVISTNGTPYTVSAGESLYSIAMQHDMSVDDILAANPDITSPYIIYPGQTIYLPSDNENKRTIGVNGYAYPGISSSVLASTLPYLTYISVFSYSVTADGSLSNLDDESIIAAAKAAGVAPLMVITNTVPEGGFNSDVAHSILNESVARENLINSAIRIATEKGYYGINIDFEYIYPDDRNAYNDFLAELKQRTSDEGLGLSTAVAPKISDTQQGLLYEAHDYAFHSKTVDFVTIMTYEWGYLYGPPMAISPYPEVKKVISYAVSVMQPSKIFMGMSNYGYDWTLPFVKGRPARVLSVQQAVELAGNVGATIQYNENSQAPFFEYTDQSGSKHIVWFENARSVSARLSLVNDYGLGGVSYWNINTFFPQNWLVLEDMFNIRKIL